MNFIEILLLFLCFCVISAGINILEKLASAKLMKVQIQQYVDTAFTSVIRSVMKYRLAAKAVFTNPKEEKEVDQND